MAELTELQNHTHDGINTQKINVYNVIPTLLMTSSELTTYLSRVAIDGEEFNCYIKDLNKYVKYVRINSQWVELATDTSFNYFGNGEDGDAIITTDTSLNEDKFYSTLTVENGVTLDPNGYRIFVTGSTILKGTGKIARNGNNGSEQTGGAALADGTIAGGLAGGNGGSGGEYSGGGRSGYDGVAGSNATSIANLAGKKGGNGGDANISLSRIGGIGGAGGTTASENALFENKEVITITTLTLDTENDEKIYNLAIVKGASSGETLSATASSGGGGGGATVGNESVAGNGGGAGGNGGIVYLASNKIVTVDGNDFIQVKGGNGANGGNASTGTPNTSGGGGGGGAGGNGGLAIVIYKELVGTGIINVSGGTGGLGGDKGPTNTETHGDGYDAPAGNNGKYIKIKIS